MPTLRRPTALAAAATLVCALSAAHAASISLIASGDDVFVCGATLTRADGAVVAATPEHTRISRYAPEVFDFGAIGAGEDGSSPNFSSLRLRCWIRAPLLHGTVPYPGEPSYSIDLHRTDGIWRTREPLLGTLAVELPGDDTQVHFQLAHTGDEARPIRIVDAMITSLGRAGYRYGLIDRHYAFSAD